MATPRNTRPGMLLDPGAPINKGLVGWWPMWEGAGGKTLDISGKNNHGTLTNGPVWSGDGLKFDGTDDYVTIPRSHVVFPATIMADIYPTATSPGGTIFSHDSGVNNGYRLQFRDSTGVLALTFGAVALYSSGLPVVPLYRWTRVGISVTSNGGVGKIYMDAAVASVSVGTMSGTPNIFSIAARAGTTEPQACIIRNCRFWNRVLSDLEVQQLYINPNIGLWVPDTTRYYIPAAAGGAKKYYLGGNAANRGQRGMGWAA